jgi:hypothetical protein
MRETYPCKGVININFSALGDCITVKYGHLPIHREHKPPARKPKKEKDKLIRDTERYFFPTMPRFENLIRK